MRAYSIVWCSSAATLTIITRVDAFLQSLHAVGRQQQQILEQSIEYQEALINERAEGIAVIQRDMAELNSMMKEINSMVIGQQDLVSMCRASVRERQGRASYS